MIELDGNHHASPKVRQYDTRRTTTLNELGITVIRFWNKEIMDDIENVLKKIVVYLD